MLNWRKCLLEDDAVAGIRSPTNYLYIRVVRFTLKLVKSWPSKEIGEVESGWLSSVHLVLITILTFTHLIGGILFICLHGNDLIFIEIGYAYITTFMNVVITSRLLTLTFSTKYRNVAKEFLQKIHLFYFKDISEYAMKTHRRVHFISHHLTAVLAAQTLAGLIFFNIIPMSNYFSSGCFKNVGYRNLTYESSVYIIYPFNTYSSNIGYVFITFFNCISSTLAANWFCLIDLFLSLMVFHIWGHFKILIHKLNTFPRPAAKPNKLEISQPCEKYSDNELFKVSELLKECVGYHKFIISFTNKMSDAFGSMLFVYYAFHQVSGCLLLLECSQMTAAVLMRYVPVTIILFQQLIQLSVIFELIGSTSENLKDAVYGLPWEFMDVKNRRTVLIFLMNVQKPIHVKALGVADVGVRSMASILKTSMSYFTFLRSM